MIAWCKNCGRRTSFTKKMPEERRRLGYCFQCYCNYREMRKWEIDRTRLSSRAGIRLAHRQYYDGEPMDEGVVEEAERIFFEEGK